MKVAMAHSQNHDCLSSVKSPIRPCMRPVVHWNAASSLPICKLQVLFDLPPPGAIHITAVMSAERHRRHQSCVELVPPSFILA